MKEISVVATGMFMGTYMYGQLLLGGYDDYIYDASMR